MPFSPRDHINFGAQIADLKEVDYRNTLAVAALIELLVEKGILTREELAEKAGALDRLADMATELSLN